MGAYVPPPPPEEIITRELFEGRCVLCWGTGIRKNLRSHRVCELARFLMRTWAVLLLVVLILWALL